MRRFINEDLAWQRIEEERDYWEYFENNRMSKDIIKMKEAMCQNQIPTDIIVGSGAAEAMGFPHAGHWHLNDEGEYVFEGHLTEESEW
jgi:hypothetical protein